MPLGLRIPKKWFVCLNNQHRLKNSLLNCFWVFMPFSEKNKGWRIMSCCWIMNAYCFFLITPPEKLGIKELHQPWISYLTSWIDPVGWTPDSHWGFFRGQPGHEDGQATVQKRQCAALVSTSQRVLQAQAPWAFHVHCAYYTNTAIYYI